MTLLGEKVETQRLAWPDATRALGVLAVVLFHALIWNHDSISGGASALSPLWDKVDLLLGRLRMPVLFALAGLLAANGMLRGWKHGTAARRFLDNYYLYAVWLGVYFAFFLVLNRPGFPHSIDSVQEFATQFIVPGTTLWFVLALAIYPAVVVLLRRAQLPVWAIQMIAVGMWTVGTFSQMTGFSGKVLQNFIFFALGVFASAGLKRVAESGWLRTGAYVGAFVTLAMIGSALPEPFSQVGVLGSSLAAVPAAIATVGQLCKVRAIARAGDFIGRRTLSIYLLHVPLLGIASLLSNSESAWSVNMLRSPVGDALYPVALAALVVLACLLGDAILKWVPRNIFLQAPYAKRSERCWTVR